MNTRSEAACVHEQALERIVNVRFYMLQDGKHAGKACFSILLVSVCQRGRRQVLWSGISKERRQVTAGLLLLWQF